MPGAKPGVADRASTALAKREEGPPSLIQLIERQQSGVERALPAHLKAHAASYTQALITVVKQTPTLTQCEPLTVLGGLMTASSLGLEFGPLGHAYLVPFKNARTNRMEAQFILGYKGIIDLAWRSGNLRSIIARTVYQADEFEFDYGLADKLEHRPDLDVESPSHRWYCMAKFREGGHAFVVLGKAGVERHRKRSKSKDKGPWVTDYDSMACKSSVIELKPFLPLTTEVLRDLSMDGVVATGDGPDSVDYDFIDVDEVTDDGTGTGEIKVEGAEAGALPLDQS